MERLTRYGEIFKLKTMLENAGIPFEFLDRQFSGFESWQICVPADKPTENRIVSVVQGYGTYGNEHDLLEIMGLLIDEERKSDSVIGYLTAQEVFDRIMKATKEETTSSAGTGKYIV